MAAGINDKFKKVSADNSYAVSTTVKTARAVGGGTTLEAFDLSRWADATAVNFLTYRKTTGPVTNVTTVTNRTGWTALVNTGSNTLTNLTIAPGYTDLGHQVGDYIEPVQMSKWANDLVDGLLTSHNQDGSLKNNVVSTAKIADGSVTASKLGLSTFGGVVTNASTSTTSVTVSVPSIIMASAVARNTLGASSSYRITFSASSGTIYKQTTTTTAQDQQYRLIQATGYAHVSAGTYTVARSVSGGARDNESISCIAFPVVSST